MLHRYKKCGHRPSGTVSSLIGNTTFFSYSTNLASLLQVTNKSMSRFYYLPDVSFSFRFELRLSLGIVACVGGSVSS